jgi:hypothetical protein
MHQAKWRPTSRFQALTRDVRLTRSVGFTNHDAAHFKLHTLQSDISHLCRAAATWDLSLFAISAWRNRLKPCWRLIGVA